jgi:photosystem II stability/assembly factor-like uncharacterized protein
MKTFDSRKSDVDVLFFTRSWKGVGDVSNFVQSSQDGLLSVVQKSAFESNSILDASDQPVLELSMTSIRGKVKVDAIETEAVGTAHSSEISRVRVKDGEGNVISEKLFDGSSMRFEFKPIMIRQGQIETLSVHADVVGDSGRTFGLKMSHSRSVSSSNAGVTVRNLHTTNDFAYIGHQNPDMEIDGAFRDWDGLLKGDDVREPRTNGDRDIDIDGYSSVKSGDNAFFYLSVVGNIMTGCSAPQGSRRFVDGGPESVRDTDRDRVPDPHDRIGSIGYSKDFNNDGTPDGLENGDIDGDGFLDYPAGPDEWLNTTIPTGFPEPYAGMQVSLFIGKVERPPVRGEDLVRIFVDTDQTDSTGYSHRSLGAEYLVEIRGRGGSVRDAVLLSHEGSPGSWNWNPLGVVEHAEDYSQMELSVEKSRIGLDDGQTYDVLFEMTDWNSKSLDSSDASLTEVTEDPFVLGDNGIVFQSTDGGATWTQKGDAGVGTGYRAIVANHSGYLFILRKNGLVFGSDDEGSTWTEVGDVGSHQDLEDMAVDANDYLYCVREGGEVYQSTDSGANWNFMSDADSTVSTRFIGLAADSSEDLYVLVTNGTVFQSTDSGSSWDYQGDAGLDTDYLDITVDGRDYVYVITSSGYVNESQDSGSSWSYQGDVGPETYTAIEWGYDTYLYVLATSGEVYRSSDGGTSWTNRGDVGEYTDLTDFTALIPEFEVVGLVLFLVFFVPFACFLRRKKGANRS